jgi:HTH-type transcriptional regulator/antitoxin HipB
MQIKTTSDIGALVRDRRAEARWSQEELAKRAGVSRLWIVQLEKGKPTAQVGLVLRVLKELGIALDAAPPSRDTSSRKGSKVVNLDRIIRCSLDAKS